jgi:hypothetical protein
MKLNRGLLLVTMLVGAVAVTGCSKSGDEGAGNDQGATQTVASADEGTTEYARFGHRGGGHGEHGGGRGEHGGGRGEHGGGRGEHGGRGGHRAWWHFWG